MGGSAPQEAANTATVSFLRGEPVGEPLPAQRGSGVEAVRSEGEADGFSVFKGASFLVRKNKTRTHINRKHEKRFLIIIANNIY